MEKVILCALEKRPEDRFPTMAAMVSALEMPGAGARLANHSSGAGVSMPSHQVAPVETRHLSHVLLPDDEGVGLRPASKTTLSPDLADLDGVTLVTTRRRGLILGGAIAGAGAFLLLAYLLLGRSGSGKPTVKALPQEVSAPSRMPALQPHELVPEPPPAVEPQRPERHPSPAVEDLGARQPTRAANTPTRFKSTGHASSDARRGVSPADRIPVTGKRAAGRRTDGTRPPSDVDEKW